MQAFAFASALSLVVMAGAELFTGNNFVMSSAAFRKAVSWADTIKLWVVCWIGNLVGSVICVAIFQITGIPSGDTAAYFGSIAAGKVGYAPIPLLARAILCNILVCLAGMVCNQDENRIRKTDHDLLVYFRLHGLWIRA